MTLRKLLTFRIEEMAYLYLFPFPVNISPSDPFRANLHFMDCLMNPEELRDRFILFLVATCD